MRIGKILRKKDGSLWEVSCSLTLSLSELICIWLSMDSTFLFWIANYSYGQIGHVSFSPQGERVTILLDLDTGLHLPTWGRIVNKVMEIWIFISEEENSYLRQLKEHVWISKTKVTNHVSGLSLPFFATVKFGN